jgi:SAM-dependent methyltransferase
MKQYFASMYRRQMFFPNWLGIFVNPFYFARSGLHQAMVEFSASFSGHLLDVGCGSKPYNGLFSVESYTGLDIENEITKRSGIADKLYKGKEFPFANGCFDSILCNQVLEHVFNPDEFISEILRVLRPGGKLLLTVPFVWDEHEQPYDYARYSSFGLHALLEKHGFSVIAQKKLGTDFSTICQITNAYLYKVSQRLPKVLILLMTVTVMATVNIVGLLSRLLLPENPDFYLDQIVLAEKP